MQISFCLLCHTWFVTPNHLIWFVFIFLYLSSTFWFRESAVQQQKKNGSVWSKLNKFIIITAKETKFMRDRYQWFCISGWHVSVFVCVKNGFLIKKVFFLFRFFFIFVHFPFSLIHKKKHFELFGKLRTFFPYNQTKNEQKNMWCI